MAIVDRTKLLARPEVRRAISKVRRALRSVLSGATFGQREVAALPISGEAVRDLSLEAGRVGLTTNGGAHGLTEIVFAHASCAANNGMTMAGLNANTPFYNVTLMISMMVGRFGLAIPALALAGRLAAQRARPRNIGSVPSEGGMFVGLVLATCLLVGALTYFPVLALGPIVEQLMITR